MQYTLFNNQKIWNTSLSSQYKVFVYLFVCFVIYSLPRFTIFTALVLLNLLPTLLPPFSSLSCLPPYETQEVSNISFQMESRFLMFSTFWVGFRFSLSLFPFLFFVFFIFFPLAIVPFSKSFPSSTFLSLVELDFLLYFPFFNSIFHSHYVFWFIVHSFNNFKLSGCFCCLPFSCHLMLFLYFLPLNAIFVILTDFSIESILFLFF